MGSLTRKGDWLSDLEVPWILCQGVWNILYCMQRGQLRQLWVWVREWHDELVFEEDNPGGESRSRERKFSRQLQYRNSLSKKWWQPEWEKVEKQKASGVQWGKSQHG